MAVLAEIPFSLEHHVLLERLHTDADTDDGREFGEMVDRARQAAKPKAIYRESFVEARTDDTVTLDGVTFTSRAMVVNLEDVHRVFAFVATCGREIDDLGLASGDFVKQYWVDTIKAALLSASVRHLNAHLTKTYALGKTSSMSPGSGDVTVWPIEQQRLLFELLGDVEGSIGVQLTDSCLMLPNKTVSGIRFPKEVDFRSCQLCHRDNCPSRGAPFDEALWQSMEHGTGSGA